jgi:hypothetical protein
MHSCVFDMFFSPFYSPFLRGRLLQRREGAHSRIHSNADVFAAAAHWFLAGARGIACPSLLRARADCAVAASASAVVAADATRSVPSAAALPNAGGKAVHSPRSALPMNPNQHQTLNRNQNQNHSQTQNQNPGLHSHSGRGGEKQSGRTFVVASHSSAHYGHLYTDAFGASEVMQLGATGADENESFFSERPNVIAMYCNRHSLSYAKAQNRIRVESISDIVSVISKANL